MFKNKIKSNTNYKEVEENLKRLSKLQLDELFKEYETSWEGVSIVEVDDRLEESGRNIIETADSSTILTRVLDSLINPFNTVLLIVALVTFITDVILSDPPAYETFFLIIITVFVSAVISFTQQEKSNKAAKKLKNLITNKVDVIRDDIESEIDIEEVVPGDIVKLSSGDMIPGDVRFLRVKDLFIDQASLTGESVPVEKFDTMGKTEDITSIDNIGFMGTNIVSGTAFALVLSTGNGTYFGSMAKSLTSVHSESSFERGVNSVSRLLIRFMLVLIPIIVLLNLVTKSDLWESIIFGIAITVGLTPEMMPVIMTSTLAKGAIDMSKKKSIVKRLGSIQTFGEMDILCTDKTGTLTEDEIVLEKYMNVHGDDDLRILRHAFLNSYFQTGLKNLIDIAIISRAEKEELNILKERYKIEDEIPFDFVRRRMSVVLRDDNGKRQLITKGAVDEMLSICSYVEINGVAEKITDELRKKAYSVYQNHNKQGFRVVAVAQKNEIHDVKTFGINDEKDMVLIGFVSFLDPPKESAKEAIASLKRHGVDTVVLTGDSEGVALNVCKKVGIEVVNRLTGTDIDAMTDEQLKVKVENCHLFSKLTPFQKQRIVRIYQENGHTVGYMGDGINDSPPLKQSDVGISVDTAVDIAKETADIILLEKDLNVLEEGVTGGRRTFANITKYIKMATSGNFGNMISVIVASMFLPFLPLMPIHILIQNLLNDFAQIGMPFDNVDEEYLEKPKKWDTKTIKSFMFYFGFISTIFDILCFLVLWYILGFNSIEKQKYFQTGWFMFGIISQTLVIHMIRTHKRPFVNSFPSKQLVISTFTITAITLIIGFTGISYIFELQKMPIIYFGWLMLLIAGYSLAVQIFKKVYMKRYNEWI